MNSKHRSSPRKRDIAQRCPSQQARKRFLTVYHHAIFQCRSVATRRTERPNTAGRVARSTGCTLPKDAGMIALVRYSADCFFYRAIKRTSSNATPIPRESVLEDGPDVHLKARAISRLRVTPLTGYLA
jgi:hypothetical protein